jgi:hypothetical protein
VPERDGEPATAGERGDARQPRQAPLSADARSLHQGDGRLAPALLAWVDRNILVNLGCYGVIGLRVLRPRSTFPGRVRK